MIIKPNKHYECNSIFPSTDFLENGNYVVDETTEEGKVFARKVIQHAPYFDFVFDSVGNLIDITPTERPPEPIKPPTPEERISALEEALMLLI